MERGYVEWDPYEILNIDRVSVSEHKQRECVPRLSTGSYHCWDQAPLPSAQHAAPSWQRRGPGHLHEDSQGLRSVRHTLLHHELLWSIVSLCLCSLTDDESRENYEKYGNPDGPRAATFGIALPSWIVDKDNSFLVSVCEFSLCWVLADNNVWLNVISAATIESIAPLTVLTIT